jgi:hypothetical protein
MTVYAVFQSRNGCGNASEWCGGVFDFSNLNDAIACAAQEQADMDEFCTDMGYELDTAFFVIEIEM